jgi:hypothetical protein
MSFVSGAAGTPGLRIGVAATADIKHVSDLTNLAVGERAFFGTCFKITTAAADNFVRPIHALSDSGTVPGGKLQYMLSYSQAGLRAYVAGANVDLGIIPVVGKIYEVGIEIVPNPTGATTLNIWVYNVTDDAIVVDGAAASITYAAWLAMVNGGGMINRAYAVDGTAPLTSAVVYRAYQGVVSTTSVSPRSAEEQFFTEARLMREAYVAAKLA